MNVDSELTDGVLLGSVVAARSSFGKDASADPVGCAMSANEKGWILSQMKTVYYLQSVGVKRVAAFLGRVSRASLRAVSPARLTSGSSLSPRSNPVSTRGSLLTVPGTIAGHRCDESFLVFTQGSLAGSKVPCGASRDLRDCGGGARCLTGRRKMRDG